MSIPQDSGPLAIDSSYGWKSGAGKRRVTTGSASDGVGVWGEESFRWELLTQMEGRMGEHHYGAERQESAQRTAERPVREGLKKAG